MIIAYLRVSTEKQHLENQRSEINRYVVQRNLHVDQWVQEIVSGATDKTTRQLGKLIQRLKKGDLLVVTEISRLSRSLHEIMVIMKHCVDHSVEVHSTKDGYIFDDSLNSKVLSFAFGLAAEIEHKLISQRIKEALASRKAEGKHIGRSFGSDYKFKKMLDRKTEILALIINGQSIKKICQTMCFSTTLLDKIRQCCPAIDQAIRARTPYWGKKHCGGKLSPQQE